jgi:hypothetical protein
MTTRLKLPARIRNKRNTAGDFEARMALADRIADLPGIEIIERSVATAPCRIDIYLRRAGTNGKPKGKPACLFCSLDRESATVSGLDEWSRYQVLSNGWGKLDDELVCVYLPRDRKELETVWLIVQRAHSNLFDASLPEPGSLTVSTWDWPEFSRTSLQ